MVVSAVFFIYVMAYDPCSIEAVIGNASVDAGAAVIPELPHQLNLSNGILLGFQNMCPTANLFIN